ncbi:hypothetical protein E2C01_037398 [Portunus trituberculatus]|uniref:Uncharacterized protein n=1 Tax=Portunus trituberculatus TaxID=210409 RepID=A0A5B7FEI1_PORTR|nr:hypothetical protein [Portunus trituberculatus]
MKSTFCHDKGFLITLFNSHIRPSLEFSSIVWNTGYLGDLKFLESPQQRWTKQLAGMTDLKYADPLQALNLYSVQGRLIRADLIKISDETARHYPTERAQSSLLPILG